MTVTWRQLLAEAEQRLGSAADARHIVERASGYRRAELTARLDDPASTRAVAFSDSMVARRAAGEPLQYVLGQWAFRRLDLLVDRRALIPRPETEAVVEVALAEARTLDRGPGAARLRVVDLGTGTGAIALSLAQELNGSLVWATDRSAGALAVARANLAGVGSEVAPRVQLHQGSWFDALPLELQGHIDLIVSNPPYVAGQESLPAEVEDWEPHDSLVAGPTGLEAISEILAGAGQWLARPGVVVLELAPHQAGEAVPLAEAAGAASVDVFPDLAGRARVLVGRFPA